MKRVIVAILMLYPAMQSFADDTNWTQVDVWIKERGLTPAKAYTDHKTGGLDKRISAIEKKPNNYVLSLRLLTDPSISREYESSEPIPVPLIGEQATFYPSPGANAVGGVVSEIRRTYKHRGDDFPRGIDQYTAVTLLPPGSVSMADDGDDPWWRFWR